MRRYGERMFGILLALVLVVMLGSVRAKAYTTSKDGVTMYYFLTQSGNTWTATTYCYEDMSSMVSLFLCKSEGGALLNSDCVKVHNRTVMPGTSVTRTYASKSFTNSSAKYGRSVHALLWPNTNTPYMSSLELKKTK